MGVLHLVGFHHVRSGISDYSDTLHMSGFGIRVSGNIATLLEVLFPAVSNKISSQFLNVQAFVTYQVESIRRLEYTIACQVSEFVFPTIYLLYWSHTKYMFLFGGEIQNLVSTLVLWLASDQIRAPCGFLANHNRLNWILKSVTASIH